LTRSAYQPPFVGWLRRCPFTSSPYFPGQYIATFGGISKVPCAGWDI
jgi:hypothetical protein